MNMSNHFELSRFWFLLKLEWFKSKRALGITLAVFMGLGFVGFISEVVIEHKKVLDNAGGNFAAGLLLIGFIITSLAFHDLGDTLKRYGYLTLPVSALEKFLSMWLLTTVGWILLYTSLSVVYSFFTIGVGKLVFGHVTIYPLNPFTSVPLNAMRYYIVLQSLFMVGATQFRGYVFLKTLAAVLILALVIGLIAYLIFADMLPFDECASAMNPLEDPTIRVFCNIVVAMFWWLLAPVCWIATYLGIKEQEA